MAKCPLATRWKWFMKSMLTVAPPTAPRTGIALAAERSETTTLNRVAAALLKMAVDFGLLRGNIAKEFESYHLPERSFLYLLYVLREKMQSPRKVLASEDWRMFLMQPSDVEQELLRLHQYRKVDYQIAGSIVQLTLPCANACEYAERMVA